MASEDVTADASGERLAELERVLDEVEAHFTNGHYSLWMDNYKIGFGKVWDFTLEEVNRILNLASHQGFDFPSDKWIESRIPEIRGSTSDLFIRIYITDSPVSSSAVSLKDIKMDSLDGEQGPELDQIVMDFEAVASKPRNANFEAGIGEYKAYLRQCFDKLVVLSQVVYKLRLRMEDSTVMGKRRKARDERGAYEAEVLPLKVSAERALDDCVPIFTAAERYLYTSRSATVRRPILQEFPDFTKFVAKLEARDPNAYVEIRPEGELYIVEIKSGNSFPILHPQFGGLKARFDYLNGIKHEINVASLQEAIAGGPVIVEPRGDLVRAVELKNVEPGYESKSVAAEASYEHPHINRRREISGKF